MLPHPHPESHQVFLVLLNQSLIWVNLWKISTGAILIFGICGGARRVREAIVNSLGLTGCNSSRVCELHAKNIACNLRVGSRSILLFDLYDHDGCRVVRGIPRCKKFCCRCMLVERLIDLSISCHLVFWVQKHWTPNNKPVVCWPVDLRCVLVEFRLHRTRFWSYLSRANPSTVKVRLMLLLGIDIFTAVGLDSHHAVIWSSSSAIFLSNSSCHSPSRIELSTSLNAIL